MQPVVVAGPITQQQGCRSGLSGAVAELEIGGMIVRKTFCKSQTFVPGVRNTGKHRVQRCAQIGDARGQGIGQILVFALPEAIPLHDDMTAKSRLVIVECGKAAAILF